MGGLRLALFLFAGLSIALGQSSDTLSLDEFIRRGLQSSGSLQSKRLSVLAAKSEAQSLGAHRMPSLILKGSYQYTSETQELGSVFPSIPGFTAPSIQFGDGNVYDVNATATLPLYSGGALISRERAALADAQALLFDSQSDSLSLLLSLRRAYYAAAGAQAVHAAAESRRGRLHRHLDELHSSQAIGVTTEDAGLAVAAHLKAAEAVALQAEASARNARLQLGRLIGEPSAEVYPELEPTSFFSEEIDFDRSSLSTRPEIRSLDSRVLQRSHLRRSGLAGMIPSLSANAVYHYSKPGVDMIENKWMAYYTVGVSASWTVWDFHDAQHKGQSQRFAGQAIEATRADLLRAFETRALTAQQSCSGASPAERKLRERLEIETQRTDLIKSKLAAGLATESQWLDAQDDLTEAELDWISSVVALRLAEADYLYAIGR